MSATSDDQGDLPDVQFENGVPYSPLAGPPEVAIEYVDSRAVAATPWNLCGPDLTYTSLDPTQPTRGSSTGNRNFKVVVTGLDFHVDV